MKMTETVLNLLFLIFVLITVNLAYKGKVIGKTGWKKVIFLSLWFTFGGIVLLRNLNLYSLVYFSPATIGTFLLITLIWFTFPKIIRRFGEFPSYYFKNKKGNTRFMAKFEIPSMTIKYFEVMFQQTTFLFLLFIVLKTMTNTDKIFWFTLIVGIIHLGNLFFMDYKWALFYTALSIPMAILFGHLILKGMLLITVSIHLAFYLIFNARYWFKKEDITQTK